MWTDALTFRPSPISDGLLSSQPLPARPPAPAPAKQRAQSLPSQSKKRSPAKQGGGSTKRQVLCRPESGSSCADGPPRADENQGNGGLTPQRGSPSREGSGRRKHP